MAENGISGDLKITPEQQHFWDVISLNPEKLAHSFGKELSLIEDHQEFLERGEELTIFVVSNFDDEVIVRILLTWTRKYNLFMHFERMPIFDIVHERCGKIIRQNYIKSY